MEKLIHLLLPRQSNNHKAKILHSSSLFIITVLIISVQGFISLLPRIKPDILGFASNISIQEVVSLTNRKRSEAGLSALSLNQELSAAAYTKGRDMIDKDYWAHVAPDGTQPWKFFNDFGYKYRYAGENLARDFSNSSAAVEAWMNSPTHRDNILNSKYKEVGIGVVEGNLAGTDTTIIVQFFGATYADKINQPIAGATTQLPTKQLTTTRPTSVPTLIPTATPLAVTIVTPEVQAQITTPKPDQQILISPFTTTKTLSLAVVGLLLVIFIIDAVLVSRRKIARIAGRTFAHVAFLGMILTIILILKAGTIL